MKRILIALAFFFLCMPFTARASGYSVVYSDIRDISGFDFVLRNDRMFVANSDLVSSDPHWAYTNKHDMVYYQKDLPPGEKHIPGDVQVRFYDCVEAGDGRDYDFLVTLSNIWFYTKAGVTDAGHVVLNDYDGYGACLDAGSLAGDDIWNGTWVRATYQVVEHGKDEPVPGNLLMGFQDIDISDYDRVYSMDRNRYQESIHLESGVRGPVYVDRDTVLYITDGNASYYSGKQTDSEEEERLSGLSFLGDATGVTFTWCAFHAATAMGLRTEILFSRHTLTPSAEGPGTISPDTPQSVLRNSNKTFTMEADAHSHIERVLVDGAAVPVADSRRMAYGFPSIQGDHSIHAVFAPDTHTLTYHKCPPPASPSGDGDIQLSKASQSACYGEPWGSLATAKKPGYRFLGWYTQGGERLTKDSPCQGDTDAYARWEPITYLVRFHPNGDSGTGSVVTGSMGSLRASYDVCYSLPKNQYRKETLVPSEDEGGAAIRKPSVFLGWHTDKESLLPSLQDEAKILNLSASDGAVIDLYAIWDDAPKFKVVSYPDRYFTLEEAQGGAITESELLRTVEVYDRETNPIPARPGGGMGTGVTVVGYDPSEFTSLTDDGSVSVRYRVEDGAGNTGYLNITVYVSRNGHTGQETASYFRAVSRPYAGLGAGDGGLHEDSRWRQDPAYREALARAFSSTKIYDLRYSKERLSGIRDYVESHGFGNSREAGALMGLPGFPGETVP